LETPYEVARTDNCLVTFNGAFWSGHITFFEPTPILGRAWSNTFSFGNCGIDPRIDEIQSAIRVFAAAYFGESVL